MLHLILAVVAVGAMAHAPRSALAIGLVAASAIADILTGAALLPAVGVALPILVFLSAALTLAALAEQAGLTDRAAQLLALAGHGSAPRLYALACLVTAMLTAVVSLDGAVVLAVPLLLRLAAATGTAFKPLFLATVAIANAVSIAVPQGNPTNLVVIEELGLSPGAYLEHMLVPGLAAGLACAAFVALRERRALSRSYPVRASRTGPLSGDERRALVALGCASSAGWIAPLLGLAPWWAFAGATALALGAQRMSLRPSVPWRIAVQVGGLLVTIEALAMHIPELSSPRLPALLAVALAVGCFSAFVNNLPASAAVAALLGAGPAAYAASIGLAAGALATPQGSVATLIAADLAGPDAPPLTVRRLAPLALAAVVVSTVMLSATL
jgi:arsenical pump membrane protein